MASILLIEDEHALRIHLKRLLERQGFQVAEAESIPTAEAHHALTTFDLIISDVRLPGPSGTDILHRYPQVPLLLMTCYASVKSAVEAMREGAADYIAKPFEPDELLYSVQRILDKSRLQRQNAALKSDVQRDYPVAGMIGNCPAMQQVFCHIHKVAPTDSTVLILGESGTGKELVARALHEYSPRRDAPLIAVNCAAIPDSLLESELFGHEKGAFTGATCAREGLVEAAHGGTLFLDEIGELPLTAQAQLLRVLQHGEIRRVGSARVRHVNIRLVAATHRDLAARVATLQFRSDLYYRLRVMEICLPALRERGHDIVQLAHFLLEKTCQRLNRPVMTLSPDAVQALHTYSWPGNVRELENAIERAVILSESRMITGELLAIHFARPTLATVCTSSTSDATALSLDDYFRQTVLDQQDTATETELAKRLGISRKTLWERRQRLGIPRRKI